MNDRNMWLRKEITTAGKDWQQDKVEPHGLKPVAPPHASEGGTLRSIPYYAPSELRRVPSPHSSTV